MAYLAVTDFKYGMDRRRPQSSGIPGTLWELKNAVLSRGGDIERAKKFVSRYSLPAGTFGLSAISGQLFVFGQGSAPSGVPVGVQYQQLAHPSSSAMVDVLDAKTFDGKFYVIAEYADGSIYHYYDGTRVSDWDGLADAAFDYSTVAARLAEKLNDDSAVEARAYGNVVQITAKTAGTAFSLSASTTDTGTTTTPTATAATVQANVAAVAETVATGTIEITGGSSSPGVNQLTSLTVNSVEILDGAVDWVASDSATANAVVISINNGSSVHGYSAAAVGAVVTISAAAGTGTTPNGYTVARTVAGDVTATTGNMSGGVAEVAAVAQVSKVTISATTPDATDVWTITLNSVDYKTTGRASAMGTSVLVHKQRVWSTANSLFRYCALTDPSDWTTAGATGAGFINMSTEAEGAQRLIGAAVYNQNVAIFARSVVLIYFLDTDPDNNAIQQVIENTGTMAAKSVVSYGAQDVFYLDDTGVRSLRSREGYNAAYASDVGSAFDTYVQELMEAASSLALADATAVIEGKDGRYFMALGQKIIMFSYFPSSKISAWSYYDFEADIDDIVRSERDIYLRSGDTIYQYGGADRNTYAGANEFEVIATTPFMSAKDPATKKALKGFDFAAENTWKVELLVDPNDTTKTIDAGFLTGVTYVKADVATPGYTSLFAFRFTCSTAGFASLSSIAHHYTPGEKQ